MVEKPISMAERVFMTAQQQTDYGFADENIHRKNKFFSREVRSWKLSSYLFGIFRGIQVNLHQKKSHTVISIDFVIENTHINNLHS